MILIQFLLYILSVAYLGYVIYFSIGWLSINVYKAKYNFSRHPTVTIIIPVRNEEKQIGNLLTEIHNQTYPSVYIEVIVIDDDSTDETVSIINALNYKNVSVIALNVVGEINSYKKSAISLGVLNSNSELIVTTDGDCSVKRNWIASIVDFYLNEKVEFITGPVAFHQEKSWFEKIQTVEFQYLIGVSAACIKNGMPNTCNGANLAYTRSLFYEVGGYKGIDEKASGDDEMLLQKVYKQDPKLIGFLKAEEAIVSTIAKPNLSAFIHQRTRWASKSSTHADYRMKLFISILFLFNLALVLCIPFSFYYIEIARYLGLAVFLKFIFDGTFIVFTLVFFKKKKLIPYFPLVVFFYSFYIVIIALLGNFSKTYLWKGREVK